MTRSTLKSATAVRAYRPARAIPGSWQAAHYLLDESASSCRWRYVTNVGRNLRADGTNRRGHSLHILNARREMLGERGATRGILTPEPSRADHTARRNE